MTQESNNNSSTEGNKPNPCLDAKVLGRTHIKEIARLILNVEGRGLMEYVLYPDRKDICRGHMLKFYEPKITIGEDGVRFIVPGDGRNVGILDSSDLKILAGLSTIGSRSVGYPLYQ